MKKFTAIFIALSFISFVKAQNTGIGTEQPAAQLHVAGSNIPDSARGQILLSRNWQDAANSNSSAIYHFYRSSSDKDQLVFAVSGNGGQATTPLLYTNAKLVIQADGNVGVGTTTPAARLEVAGQVKITGGTPGTGKVLTSDADGLASWAAPNTSSTIHAVGESFAGGKIFFVTPDGLHGLVAETQNQGTSNYYGAQNLISTASSHSTSGKNYTDWRLPTISELATLYSQRFAIGSFTTVPSSYWSSTEADYTNAYVLNWNTTAQVFIDKSISLNIRAVRSF